MTENKNIIDIMEKWFEIITNNDTSKKLLKLKKKLAKDITKKLGITNKFEKEITINYLVNEGNFKDLIGDKLKEWIFWEKWLKIITTQLEELRDKLDKAKTKEDLEELRTDIFNETNSTKSWSKKTSNNSSTDTNTTAQTKSPAAAWQTNTDSSTWSTSTATSSTTEKAQVSPSAKSYEIDHFNITTSPESKKIRENLKWKEKPALEPFSCAMKAYNAEKSAWHLKNTKYLTVVDFTKNQLTDNRFFVINMDTNTVEYAEKCWHGAGSCGKERATSFSNKSSSNKSSLWASIIPTSLRWNGKHSWQWAFPKWLETSNNATRWIAIHPVKSLIYKTGRPTSLWCYTLTCWQAGVNEIIWKIWDWLLFSYAKSNDYFSQSKYFQKNSDGSYAA